MVDERNIVDVVERAGGDQIGLAQHRLDLLDAALGERHRALLLVLLVILGGEAGDEHVDAAIQLRRILGRSGDDQRRARLVDQDRVDLVDDGVVEGPLDHLLQAEFHVVAQIVEAELVVRAVGHVGAVLVAALVVLDPVHDAADAQAEEAVDLPHPFAVASRQVVVDGDDYLARRDSEWMGQIYRFLGLSVGCIVHGVEDDERRNQYGADVTYGTNNEFGFDYLRDNMKFRLEEMVQRPFNYAIVDEVDSILIDEARTPLIISGPAEDSSELYRRVNVLIPRLAAEDYEKDEKQRAVTLTESGVEKIEAMLREADLITAGTLYDIHNVALVHHVNQALHAPTLLPTDTDYIVKDGKLIIIDEFTGRMMEGRRYSEGLHQALEAKEGVDVQNEKQTLASITFQNYFRLYPKLAGMTGTAMTEAAEFGDIYRLDVIEVPTNELCIRADNDDEVYRTTREKYDAIVEQVAECRKRQQPMLIGTVSIEKSEALATLFKKHKIPHNVLNARYHEQEAYIIAQAGRPGTVTIATNMAGRGTDIQLGGNLEMRTVP